ncbi:unnamed protein product [Darwinula stevensoni]|uniref:Mitotic-spindle organizing protein 1 n=1 Tax=Darwinula stevensoni TaxID=69355 RepID=A0A7R8XBS5_9CRUS|nr:unnamed protein product [Darwinula stevensoni]CAG0888072.1 unnamed protein product [Darwinula stevensoni]
MPERMVDPAQQSGMPNSSEGSVVQNVQSMNILLDISDLLNTGLDAETLAVCVRLLELGIPAQALAMTIKELRKVRHNLEST